MPLDTTGDGRLEIYGSNNDATVWRKILNYRVIPESKNIALNQSFHVSLNDNKDMALYAFNTSKKDGWTIGNNALYLADGIQYANETYAEASLFVTLAQANYNLNFDATIQTEAQLDYMKVIAVYQGIETVILDKLSGSIPLANYKVDLSQFSGKAIEIRFVFQSDLGTTDKGITLKNISIVPSV